MQNFNQIQVRQSRLGQNAHHACMTKCICASLPSKGEFLLEGDCDFHQNEFIYPTSINRGSPIYFQDEFNPYENPENKQSNHYPPFGQPPIRMVKPSNAFETAAWILAIASILSCLTFYGAYVLGALAILFALLSRSSQMTLSQKSKRSLLLGITAIILTTVIFAAAFYIMLQEFGSIEGIVREYCRLSGYDFETYFGDMFPE